MFLLDLKQWMQSKNVMYDGNNDISGIFARFSEKFSQKKRRKHEENSRRCDDGSNGKQ